MARSVIRLQFDGPLAAGNRVLETTESGQNHARRYALSPARHQLGSRSREASASSNRRSLRQMRRQRIEARSMQGLVPAICAIGIARAAGMPPGSI